MAKQVIYKEQPVEWEKNKADVDSQKPTDTIYYKGREKNESTVLDQWPLYKLEPPGALTLTLCKVLGPSSSSDTCHTICSFFQDITGTQAFFQTQANQISSHHWGFVLTIVSIWKTSLLASPLIGSSFYMSQLKYYSLQRLSSWMGTWKQKADPAPGPLSSQSL